ncbi:MAG: Transcriptional regulator, AsnC family [Frankiales bacterium]|nr:Transcriptional regulator, AsnC family [Frankiales bacterium]
MHPPTFELDKLDISLLTAMRENPRAGELELSRVVGVARATVHARTRRMEEAGVIVGYGPDIDLAAAGFAVTAFVTLEIAQGALAETATELLSVPGVVEAYSTTGPGDVLCKVAARSHLALQETLLQLSSLSMVVRSTSIVGLSVVVAPRMWAPLSSETAPGSPHAPGHR